MAESDASQAEPTLVERWLQDQQQWQKTLFTYLDSMMKNDEFLMHMGNAMRGSLLAGKPYPTAPPPPPAAASADEAAMADRLDKVLFALHQLQGQMQDVLMTLDEMRGTPKPPAASPAANPSRARRTAPRTSKTKRRRARS
jgi:hypothetical protein